MESVVLRGVVVPGRGLGVERLADERLLDGIEAMFGVRIVPGTLNVRLSQPFDRNLVARYIAASELSAAWEEQTGQTGYRILPITAGGRYRGIAFQADEPGYPEDLLEVMCEVHLRSTLGLADGDPIELVTS